MSRIRPSGEGNFVVVTVVFKRRPGEWGNLSICYLLIRLLFTYSFVTVCSNEPMSACLTPLVLVTSNT